MALSLSADPLMTYIGAKAKGMGGAFTAVANNNSAMYFNPAGLVNFEGLDNTMVTLEGGTGAQISELPGEEKYDTTGTYFFGISGIAGDSGFGFAYYSLYDLELKNDGSSYASSTLREEIEVLSLSFAYKVIDQIYPGGGILSIGATAAYAGSFAGESDFDVIEVSGSFFAVGLKMRLLNDMEYKIDIGANYRTYGELSNVAETANGIGIPQETAFGIAGSYGNEIGLFTLSADYKQTGYEEATADTAFQIRIGDTTTTNVGFEYANPLYQLRTGYYETTYTSGNSNSVTGFTGGVGIVIDTISLEASYDQRTYTEATEETSLGFVTVSLNLAIE